MTPKYFQGQSIKAPVHASTVQSFADVVDKFRLPSVLGITRAAFLALPKAERDQAKQVSFFTAACFSQSPSARTTAKATVCNLIFLDIDPEKEKQDGRWVETGRYPALPFTSNPAALYQALAGFNFAAHTTASSTPEKPRMRLMVDASGIPLHRYPAAVQTIGTLLGISVTTESKVAVQPMFLPVLFSDSTEEDQPLFAFSLEGRPFTVEDIVWLSDEDIERDRVNGWKANGSNGHSHNGNGVNRHHAPEENSYDSDALLYLRAPVPEVTLAVAKEALETISADCSYHEWIELAAALKHQFSPHKLEEAYTLFDSWSSTGDKYKDAKETHAKWESLRPTPAGRLPVTIRSLMKRAEESGWDARKVKDQSSQKVLTWMEDAATATELLENGVQNILGIPLLSAIQEDVLVGQLCAKLKSRFLIPVSPTAIRKDLKRVKEEARTLEKPPEKLPEPTWCRGVCYIAAAQDFYRHRTGERYKAESFNAAYGRHLLPTEAQLAAQGIPVTLATLSRPQVQPADYALNSLKIPTFYDYAYDPSQPTSTLLVKHGCKYFNIYNPTYPDLDPMKMLEAGTLLQTHLANLVAEQEYRNTLLDFLAFQVQSPGRKARWGVLIQGAQGCGKTFLAEMMKAVLGAEHVKTISGATVRSGFSEWAFGAQLVVLEEVRAVGQSRHDIMEVLKPLITNDRIAVNEKFRNAREVDNISNYILFSNHHDAIALDPNDRRYFVIKSPLQTRAQVLALGEDYFPTLFNMLRGHPGAVRAFLHEWEISPDFRPDGHAPRTKYVQDLIEDSATDLTATIRRLLLEGDHPLVQFDIVSSKAIQDMLTMEEGLRNVSVQTISAVLREEGLVKLSRHQFGEERHYLWVRPGVGQIEESEVAREAAMRLKGNLKNLCMELLFS